MKQQPTRDSQSPVWQLKLPGDGKAKAELPESASPPTARALRGQQGQQLLLCTAPVAPTTGGTQLLWKTERRDSAGNPLLACFGSHRNFSVVLPLELRFVSSGRKSGIERMFMKSMLLTLQAKAAPLALISRGQATLADPG